MNPPPLYAHQREDVEFCVSNPLVFNTSDPGTGKSRVCLEVAKQLKLPTLVLAPKSILRASWEADARRFTPELTTSVAFATNRREAFAKPANVYITNTDATTWLVKHPDILAKFKDGLLIVDECFPGTTLIDCPAGNKPISIIKEGDLVLTSQGPLPVTKVFKKRTRHFVCLEFTDGTTLRCTPNHPFATTNGWVEAANLQDHEVVTTQNLQTMREPMVASSVLPGASRKRIYNSLHQARLLLKKLCKKSNARQKSSIASSLKRTSCFSKQREACLEQWNTYARVDQVQTQQDHETKRGSLSPVSRGQRSWYESLRRTTSTSTAIHIFLELLHSYQTETKRRLSSLLQSRFWGPFTEDSYRGRWSVPSNPNRQKTRQQKNSSPPVLRVACVTHLESDCPEYVWNLEVAGPHDYFVEGKLVHNCTAFKHHTAQRSKAAQKLAQVFARRILLTGTPNPNGVLDLWGQLFLLDGGQRLGKSYYGFRSAACTPTQVGRGANMVRWTDRPGIEEVVFDMVSDCTIRHKLEDVLDMPERVVTTLEVDLSPEHRAQYLQLATNAWLELEHHTVSAVNAATLLTKLLQCLSGAVYDENGHAALIDTDRYELILDLVEQRPHTLVAFLWRHQRDQLVAEAKKRGLTYGVIDGSTPVEQRTHLVNEFQAGRLRVMFAHPQSAGHGLTLTKGTTTIWASPTWNAEHYDQFCHRIYRAGQTQRTETIHIAARDTHELEVYRRLTEKLDSMSLLLSLLGGNQ